MPRILRNDEVVLGYRRLQIAWVDSMPAGLTLWGVSCPIALDWTPALVHRLSWIDGVGLPHRTRLISTDGINYYLLWLW